MDTIATAGITELIRTQFETLPSSSHVPTLQQRNARRADPGDEIQPFRLREGLFPVLKPYAIETTRSLLPSTSLCSALDSREQPR